MAKPKNATSLCLSDEAREILHRRAGELGITKSAALEIALRWWNRHGVLAKRNWVKK